MTYDTGSSLPNRPQSRSNIVPPDALDCKRRLGYSLSMSLLLRFFAVLYGRYIDGLERKIGYRLRMSFIPPAWINGYVRFNMSPSWREHGIKVNGVSQWTIGALAENGVSSRYDRNRKEYQSWCGAYLVKFEEDRDFTVQDHFDLGIADQVNWLRDMGDPRPYFDMPARGVAHTEEIRLGEYAGTLYEGLSWPSHSDVGKRSKNFRSWRLMALCAALFNASNPALRLKARNFLPDKAPTEYEPIIMKGYIGIIKLEKNTYVVLGGNAAALVDDKGAETHDYFPALQEDILAAFRAVQIQKVS